MTVSLASVDGRTHYNNEYIYQYEETDYDSESGTESGPRDLNQNILSCDAKNYNPNSHVTWIKNGFFIDNGLPPGGFSLNVTAMILEGTKLGLAGIYSLQGYYQCQVWSEKPYKPTTSSQALLKFSGMYTQISIL